MSDVVLAGCWSTRRLRAACMHGGEDAPVQVQLRYYVPRLRTTTEEGKERVVTMKLKRFLSCTVGEEAYVSIVSCCRQFEGLKNKEYRCRDTHRPQS